MPVPWLFSSMGFGSGAAGGGFAAWVGGKWLVAINAVGLAGRVRMGLLASTAPTVFPGEGVVTGTKPSFAAGAELIVFAGDGLSPDPFVVLPSSIVRAALGEGGFTTCEASPCALVAALSPLPGDVAGAPDTSGAAEGDGLVATDGSAIGACVASSGAGSVRGAAPFAAGVEPRSGS